MRLEADFDLRALAIEQKNTLKLRIAGGVIMLIVGIIAGDGS